MVVHFITLHRHIKLPEGDNTMQNENELQRAIYYLNNRHRLNSADMPRYVWALAVARQYGIEPVNGIWYMPETTSPTSQTC